jgi:hypothetical protein
MRISAMISAIVNFLWFSSVAPMKCWDSTLKYVFEGHFASLSFNIGQSSVSDYDNFFSCVNG